MDTCDTCKWWKGPLDGEVLGECSYVLTDDHDIEDTPVAIVKQFSRQGAAWLVTAPTFGCTSHEPKDTE